MKTKRIVRNKKKLRVLSLFSGAGGMDLGFVQAGFEIVWANDFFKEACDTYSLNIGEIVCGDITKIDSSEMPDNIDVVIGGFPCQGFSIANTKRSMEDKRNFLYLELLRVIKDKQPKVFVAENVKGLMNMNKGKVLELVMNDFKSLGYNVDFKLLNAAEYGVPQLRERLIIIGNRIGKINRYPKKTHFILKEDEKKGLKPAITCEEAIGWLSDVKLSKEPFTYNGKTIFNHIGAQNVADTFWGRKYDIDQIKLCDYLREYRKKSGLSNKKIAELVNEPQTLVDHWFRNDNNSGSIPSPEHWKQLKKILKLDSTYDEQIMTIIEKPITYEQSLRITNWDRPSDTITATSPEIHVNKKRRLSVRECAIIQTFPDNFIFTGSLNRMYTQVGNAVPVLLAKKIAQCVKKMIEV